jgi:hypothetical protein
MEPLASNSPASPANADGPKPGTYSPVTVYQEDTIGAIFLGILTFTLFIAFMRAEARNRALLAQLASAR